MRRLSLLGLLTLAVGASGCFKLNRGAPLPRQYALGAGRGVSAAAATTTAAAPGSASGSASPSAKVGIDIGVRRLILAPYLDIPLLVVRKGSREITFSDFQRWAEPLTTGINAAVARYVSGRGAIRVVDVAPWPPRERYDYVVQLHVHRFEGEQPDGAGAGTARLLADWEIIRMDDGSILSRGTTDYRKSGWRPGDYDGLVALLDEGLVVMSDAIVAKLTELAALPPGVPPA